MKQLPDLRRASQDMHGKTSNESLFLGREWQPNAPLVWAIVLNWNRPEDTRLCVESLRTSDYPALEILVVDNGSEPESYKELCRVVSGVKILRSETNLGFAAGSNLGIKYALDHDAAYVLLLNNDTLIDTQMISILVEAMESDKKVGIAGPIIYYLHTPEKVWFAGERIKGQLYVLRRGLHLKPPLKLVEEVDFVSGCGMLIRREMLENVGLFSPDYFMYYEDLDLCLRAQKAGWKVICVTAAKMWHAVSASSGGPESPIKQYYQLRSSLIFYRRYTRGIMFVVNMGLRLSHAIYSSFKYLACNGLKGFRVDYYFRGIRDGMRS